MPDASAFPLDQYAFPSGQAIDQPDEAAQSEQRNRDIQAAFDTQRARQNQAQSAAKTIASQAAQIARLKQQKGVGNG